MFKVPEKHRILGNKGELNGVFKFHGLNYRTSSRDILTIIASNGLGWEHVSVSKKYECPTWDEMCAVKSIFWDDTDSVIQVHPAKKDYINNHPYCLHLWRPTDFELILPNSILVGIKFNEKL